MVKAKETDYDGGTGIRRCTTREISEAVGQFSESYHGRLGELKFNCFGSPSGRRVLAVNQMHNAIAGSNPARNATSSSHKKRYFEVQLSFEKVQNFLLLVILLILMEV